MIDLSRIHIMADSGRLTHLERGLGWAMSQSCHDGLYGTPEARERSFAAEDALRARIKAARAYLRSEDYAADCERENDWIAR